MGIAHRTYSVRQGSLKRKMHKSLLKRVKPVRHVRLKGRKRVGSKLLNKTKKEKAKVLPTRAGTEDILRIIAKPRKLINKLGAQINNSHYQLNNSVLSYSDVGKQGFVQLQYICNQTDLYTMLANVVTRDGAGLLGRTGVTPGSSTIPNLLATEAGMLTTTMQVNSCKTECMITNNGSSVMRLILHDAMPRQNIFTNISGNTNTPLYAISDGVKHETYAGTDQSYTHLSTKPTDSKIFNQNWKIIKTTYTELAPGQTHYHRITYAPYKRFDAELITQPNFFMQRRYGIATFCQIYGQPTTDNAGTGATVQRADLACVCKKSYNYSWLQPDRNYNDIVTNIGTTSSTSAINLCTGLLNAYVHG